MNNNSIGVFDSGVGGLSVWKELIKILPNENIIYYADSDNCPYGTKTQKEIIKLSKRIVDFFITRDVKLVVVACNTATAAAIDYLRQNYTIPFIGMEPAVKQAAQRTKKGIIGVLATEGTFNGRLFNETTDKWASDIEVEVQVGKGFVELVEQANFETQEAKEIVGKVIKPLLDKGIDQLVLACTHYPFLYKTIKTIAKGTELEIIDPAPAVAKQTQNILQKFDLLTIQSERQPTYEFCSSGNPKIMKRIVKIINSDILASFEKLVL
jgi:glutamate racemase